MIEVYSLFHFATFIIGAGLLRGLYRAVVRAIVCFDEPLHQCLKPLGLSIRCIYEHACGRGSLHSTQWRLRGISMNGGNAQTICPCLPIFRSTSLHPSVPSNIPICNLSSNRYGIHIYQFQKISRLFLRERSI